MDVASCISKRILVCITGQRLDCHCCSSSTMIKRWPSFFNVLRSYSAISLSVFDELYLHVQLGADFLDLQGHEQRSSTKQTYPLLERHALVVSGSMLGVA